MGIQFENKINAGHVASLISAAIVLVGLFLSGQLRLSEIDHRVKTNTENMTRTTEILIQLQDEVRENRDWRLRREAVLESLGDGRQ